MALTIDPKGLEIRAMHELVDFRRKDVLEVGCGDGRVTWRFATSAANLVAIDPDRAAIDTARNALPETLRSTVSFRVGDVTTTELPEGGYDVVVFSGSL